MDGETLDKADEPKERDEGLTKAVRTKRRVGSGFPGPRY